MADVSYDEVVVVLEGAAKQGVPRGRDGHVHVTHAKGSGDDAIVSAVAEARATGAVVTVVTADRLLQARVQGLGAQVVGPGWLLTELDEQG